MGTRGGEEKRRLEEVRRLCESHPHNSEPGILGGCSKEKIKTSVPVLCVGGGWPRSTIQGVEMEGRAGGYRGSRAQQGKCDVSLTGRRDLRAEIRTQTKAHVIGVSRCEVNSSTVSRENAGRFSGTACYIQDRLADNGERSAADWRV